jgi:hypothetical protein
VTDVRNGSLVGPQLSNARAGCPSWCAHGHGVHRGEEDWLHLSEPLPIAEGVSARLCLSIDPLTRAEDGPYMVIGTYEYSLPQAQALGASLLAMVNQGADASSALVAEGVARSSEVPADPPCGLAPGS